MQLCSDADASASCVFGTPFDLCEQEKREKMDRGRVKNVVMFETLTTKGKVMYVLTSLALLVVSGLIAGLAPTQFRFPYRDEYDDVVVDNGNDPLSGGWKFVNNKYSNNFELILTPVPKGSMTDRELKRDITLNVTVSAFRYGHEDEFTVVGQRSELVRQVECHFSTTKNRSICKPITVFHDPYVSFEGYRFDVALVGEINWLAHVNYDIKQEQLKFAIWEIRINYTCFGLAVIGLIYWVIICKVDFRRSQHCKDELDVMRVNAFFCNCGTNSCPYRNAAQKWILTLLIGVSLYNQPLYGFQYLHTSEWREFFIILSAVLQVAFASILLVFFLAVFESLYKEPPYGRLFYWPKVLFGLYFFVGGSIIYGRAISRNIDDIFYLWKEDESFVESASAFFALSTLFYTLWISFVILRALSHIRSFSSVMLKIILFGHLWRALAVIIGVAIGTYFAGDLRFRNVTFFYQYMLTFYVLEVVFLYQPVSRDVLFVDDAASELGAQNTGFEMSSARSPETASISTSGGGSPDARTTTEINLGLV